MTKQELEHIKLTLKELSKTGIRVEGQFSLYDRAMTLVERELNSLPRLVKHKKMKFFDHEDLGPDCVRLPR